MTIKIAGIQHACGEDQSSNWASSKRLIEEAAKQGASLVVLQELHSSAYFCQREDDAFFDLAQPIPGPASDYFSQTAKDNNVVLVVSLFEKAEDKYYNCSLVFECDGTMVGKYRKCHIPEDPGFHEKYYFEPGDNPLEPIVTSIGKLGLLICWDQWFPEAARTLALKGAQLLIYPTAIGWIPEDPQEKKEQFLDAWVTIQRSHAIANGLPVISVNRIGKEIDPQGPVGHIEFWGNSFITGAFGEFLSQASKDNEEIIMADIDFRDTEITREVWPFFRDRRKDLYKL